MKKRGSKKAQLKLSFGMIFSIILIIIFIAFAFYAIQKFLNIQKSVEIGRFVNELQNDVNKMWRGSQGSVEEEYRLPLKIKSICFVDYSSSKNGKDVELYDKLRQVYYEKENMIFYPVGSAEGHDSIEVENINIEKIIESNNPFCVKNIKGKIKISIEMDAGDSLVTLG